MSDISHIRTPKSINTLEQFYFQVLLCQFAIFTDTYITLRTSKNTLVNHVYPVLLFIAIFKLFKVTLVLSNNNSTNHRGNITAINWYCLQSGDNWYNTEGNGVHL